MESKLAFLSSVRFWKLAATGALAGAAYLFPSSAYVHAAAITIGIWFGGSVVVGTVDKLGDAKVKAAQVSSDQLTEVWPKG